MFITGILIVGSKKEAFGKFTVPLVAELPDVPTDNNTTTNETHGITIDLVPIFTSFVRFLGSGILFMVGFNMIWQFYHHPYLKVRKQSSYEYINIGRYFHDAYDEELRLYRYYIKDHNGIQEFYCKENFQGLMKMRLDVWLICYWEYPDVTYKKLKLPETVKRFEKDLSTHKVWKVVYKVLSLLPVKRSVLRIYNDIAVNNDKRMEEINYLELRPLMQRIEYQFDAEFEEQEMNKNKSEMVWVPRKMSLNASTLALKKKGGQVRNAIVTNFQEKIESYMNVSDAIENERTLYEVRALYEYKTLSLEQKIMALSKENLELAQLITKLKTERNTEISKALKQIEEEREIQQTSMISLLAKAMGKEEWGFSEEESIRDAMRDERNKQLELEKELAKHQGKLEILSEIVKQNNNKQDNNSGFVLKE